MKALVIYDSAYGNTKKIAEIIANELKAKALRISEVGKKDLEGLSLLVVGSPINGWRPLPTISNFLDSLEPGSLNNVKTAAFDTRVKLFIHGDAKSKIANLLKIAGATILGTEAFYVEGSEGPLFEGEVEKAACFAQSLKGK